ncbi:hypothetical protein GOP47_0012385 [Adiantum capillus-veneris]|uniref:Vacuolar protein sorting-associated protein 29 n=1 Tax=Adiantum capillus-veneris TaxID=13818 RepID=A0A9D4ZED7_ADICA|nr:hypothetical protein GOP47_0012385 [Adiantum capillus-veneris]
MQEEVALATVGDGSSPLLLGLISDTHGLLDSATLRAFRAAAPYAIIHAGDVGDKSKKQRLSAAKVLKELRESTVNKMVVAVAGNTDESASNLPSFQIVVVWGIRILIVHICGFPPKISSEMQQLVDATSPQIVIFGHSHMPGVQWHNNILFVNPGSAGPRRFKLPRCMALLYLHSSGEADVRFISVGESLQDVKGLPEPMMQFVSPRR